MCKEQNNISVLELDPKPTTVLTATTLLDKLMICVENCRYLEYLKETVDDSDSISHQESVVKLLCEHLLVDMSFEYAVVTVSDMVVPLVLDIVTNTTVTLEDGRCDGTCADCTCEKYPTDS